MRRLYAYLLILKYFEFLSAKTFAYDKSGRRTKLTLPNSATANYTYDTGGRLTGLAHKRTNGEIIASYGYTMDKTGNRLTKTEALTFPSSSSPININTKKPLPEQASQRAKAIQETNRDTCVPNYFFGRPMMATKPDLKGILSQIIHEAIEGYHSQWKNSMRKKSLQKLKGIALIKSNAF